MDGHTAAAFLTRLATMIANGYPHPYDITLDPHMAIGLDSREDVDIWCHQPWMDPYDSIDESWRHYRGEVRINNVDVEVWAVVPHEEEDVDV